MHVPVNYFELFTKFAGWHQTEIIIVKRPILGSDVNEKNEACFFCLFFLVSKKTLFFLFLIVIFK